MPAGFIYNAHLFSLKMKLMPKKRKISKSQLKVLFNKIYSKKFNSTTISSFPQAVIIYRLALNYSILDFSKLLETSKWEICRLEDGFKKKINKNLGKQYIYKI